MDASAASTQHSAWQCLAAYAEDGAGLNHAAHSPADGWWVAVDVLNPTEPVRGDIENRADRWLTDTFRANLPGSRRIGGIDDSLRRRKRGVRHLDANAAAEQHLDKELALPDNTPGEI